jgi:hypothetical protein
MSLSNEKLERDLRRHARVDDDIVLFWRQASPDDLSDEMGCENFPTDRASLSAKINLLNLESDCLLQSIGQSHPLLADYLKILERKIDVIARALAAHEPSRLLSTRYVNLSASGLAFLTETDYPPGTLLEMKMILPPTQAIIVAYGRVAHHIPYFEGLPRFYRIGVDFVHLREDDRVLLACHVARRKLSFPDWQQDGLD